VSSPYRSARTPLQERQHALRRELDATTERLEGLRDLESRQQAVRRELAQVDAEVRRADSKRALPLLGQVRVAAPCSARWDDMTGDAVTRFCGSCAKHVYDLSAMTAAEAEAFLRDAFGAETCVRFVRRADGTLLTSDCPVGVSRRRVKRFAVAAVSLAGAAAGAFTALAPPRTVAAPGIVMGELAVRAEAQPAEQAEVEPPATMGLLQTGRHPVAAPKHPERKSNEATRGSPKRHERAQAGECPVGDPLCGPDPLR